MSNEVLKGKKRPLSFKLSVINSNERGNFGVQLEESGESDHAALSIKLNSSQTARIIDSVLAALRESALKGAQLHAGRIKPLRLREPAGVRLALVMMATKPLSSRRRLQEVETGISMMGTEETYYWYAKCTGGLASQAQQAMRVLLSNE
jgi:hypothetical protein